MYFENNLTLNLVVSWLCRKLFKIKLSGPDQVLITDLQCLKKLRFLRSMPISSGTFQISARHIKLIVDLFTTRIP